MKTMLNQLLAVATMSAALLLLNLPSPARAAEVRPYPLKKCVVSDEDLGKMGKAVKVTHEGTDVYLCCKSCLKDFNKAPGEFVAKVKAATKK